MKLFKISLIFGFLTLFVIACTQTNDSVNSTANNSPATNNLSAGTNIQPAGDELASAGKIYSESCVKCHKADGSGGLSVIEGRNIKAPNLSSDRQKKEPDSEYVEIIENGAKEDGMPAYKGKITDDDIRNLVKYIRREFQSR